MKTYEKARISAFVALTLIMGAACAKKASSAGPPPPATVYVTSVARMDLPLHFEAVGAFDGYDNADIRARVRGYLRSQNYKDGSPVKAGDLLFTIERAEYDAAVTSAMAALERARVALERNRIQLERYKGLLKSGMVSQQDVDNASAAVADSDGQVLAAQAQRQTAQLNLSYTQIHAPISGLAGLALVRIGNLVGQDSPTLLTTVSQVEPIRINFNVTEVDYVKFPERFKRLETRDLAWAMAQFTAAAHGGEFANGDPGVEIVLADGSVYPHRGILVAVNRQIDPSTGTIQVQALAPNPDGVLRPGQYGRVRVKREDSGQGALVVPERALVSVQGTYSVAVVGPDNKVQMRKVDLGPSAGGLQIIQSGVVEGDRVVVDGVQKVSDGATVDPRPAPAVSKAASALATDGGAAAARN